MFLLYFFAECRMSARLQPWYECTGNLLKVTWPTETVFLQNVTTVPDFFRSAISKRLKAKPPCSLMMVILTHKPP